MSQIKYKIKNKETGLYFRKWAWVRPLTKSGKISKRSIGTLTAQFGDFDNTDYFDIHRLNMLIKESIENNIPDIFDNCEVLAYTLQPVRTTVRLETVRRRLEANAIMAKLKA